MALLVLVPLGIGLAWVAVEWWRFIRDENRERQ